MSTFGRDADDHAERQRQRDRATRTVVPFAGNEDHDSKREEKRLSYAEIEEALSEMDDVAYEQVRVKKATEWGLRRRVLDRLFKASRTKWAYKQAKKKNASQARPPDENDLRHILLTEGILDLWLQDWDKVMAGEHRNAKLLYLMATSRLFDKPMSAAIKGPSSGGKSEIRRTVLEFFPPEDVIAFTSLSEKALLFHEGHFTHKILSMAEAAGGQEWQLQDYLLRELLSEGRLVYQCAQKDSDGQIRTTAIEKNGPVAFLITTTKAALNPENETRMVSLTIDDTEGQTRRVLKKQAQTLGKNKKPDPSLFHPWQDLQRLLRMAGPMPKCVVVPFADALADLIPPRATRLRRDFPQIIACIKSHALLHCRLRKESEQCEVIADLDLDYGPVRELIGDIAAEGADIAVSPELMETINRVEIATAGIPTDDGATAHEIAKALKLDKATALRRLRVAAEKGFVVNLEQRKGLPGKWRRTEQEVEAEELLPTVDLVKEHECVRREG